MNLVDNLIGIIKRLVQLDFLLWRRLSIIFNLTLIMAPININIKINVTAKKEMDPDYRSNPLLPSTNRHHHPHFKSDLSIPPPLIPSPSQTQNVVRISRVKYIIQRQRQKGY